MEGRKASRHAAGKFASKWHALVQHEQVRVVLERKGQTLPRIILDSGCEPRLPLEISSQRSSCRISASSCSLTVTIAVFAPQTGTSDKVGNTILQRLRRRLLLS